MIKTDLLRLIGLIGIFIAIAWAIQILVISHEGTTIERLLWVPASASLSGASVGLMVTSKATPDESVAAIQV